MACSMVIGAMASIGVLLLGTLLTLVALVTPHWTVVEHKGDNIVQGLFEICLKSFCLQLDEMKGLEIPISLKACRGANISAIVVAGLGCFASVLWLMRMRVSSKKKSILPSCTLGATLVSASLVTSAVVVYLVVIYRPAEDRAYMGYSVYLNAVGAFLLLVGGVAFRVVAEVRMTSLPSPSSSTTVSSPHRHDPLFFHNLHQLDDDGCQGLAYQKPQSTVLQPPPPYTQYPEQQPEYMAHMTVNRDLEEGQYTPGETRRPAPGTSSI